MLAETNKIIKPNVMSEPRTTKLFSNAVQGTLLGLRTIEGVSISKFKEKYIDNPIFLFRKELEKLVEEKLVMIDGDYIKLTNKGLDLANLVWEEFI